MLVLIQVPGIQLISVEEERRLKCCFTLKSPLVRSCIERQQRSRWIEGSRSLRQEAAPHAKAWADDQKHGILFAVVSPKELGLACRAGGNGNASLPFSICWASLFPFLDGEQPDAGF